MNGAAAAAQLRLASGAGRWVIAAVVLGSGVAFLESSVVSVALPSIAEQFGLGMAGVQWIYNSYLLSLSALILLGGSLGDILGRRRIFLLGLVGFGVTSLICAVAPTAGILVGARAVQGASAALLVPSSLAIVDTVFVESDRGAAVGAWAGWSGVSTAFGPFVGGWLIDSGSWRWVFAIPLPLIVAAVLIVLRHMPEAREADGRPRRPDAIGAVLASVGLVALVYALVEGPNAGFFDPLIVALFVVGVALIAAFFVAERRIPDPLLPPSVFASRQFTGANLTTLVMYFALGGVFFFLVLQLQNVLGYSALAAGAALVPINVIMLALSPRVGALAQRTGPRLPMTAGALVMAVGCGLLARVVEGASYATAVLPAVAVFGVGVSLLVAPLTAAVLSAVREDQAGVGSAVNNAAARLAGLLAGAVLPLAAGLGGIDDLSGQVFAAGYRRAMWICAVLCVSGAAVTYAFVREARPVRALAHPSPSQGCAQRRPCQPAPDRRPVAARGS